MSTSDLRPTHRQRRQLPRKLVSRVNNVLTIKYTRVIINYLKDSDSKDAENRDGAAVSSTYRCQHTQTALVGRLLARIIIISQPISVPFPSISFLVAGIEFGMLVEGTQNIRPA